ncbi:MAG: EAL domain-containing protein [Lachnospiraceae bacterium]|nr:EAL domain-containing protein [Lachnospiraceae bacterium]
MREAWVFSYFIPVVMLILFLYGTRRNRSHLATSIRILSVMAIVAIAANMMMFLTQDRFLTMVANSIFHTTLTWILYAMLAYVREYTGFSRYKPIHRKIFLIILALDSVNIMLNCIFEHSYTCYEIVYGPTSGTYYVVDGKPFHIVHMIISYFMALTMMVLLVRKIAHAPTIYKAKYIAVFGILGFDLFCNSLYLVLDMPVDASVTLYAFTAACIYFCTFTLSPRRLANKTINQVMTNMSEAALLYDIDGECVFINEAAEKLLNTLEKEGVIKSRNEMYQKWRSWVVDKDNDEVEEQQFLQSVNIKNAIIHLKITYQKLQDEKGRFQGSYFTVYDRTEEAQNLIKERYNATHDRLTGLYNKEHFYDVVHDYLKANPEETCLMICSDIANFKLINDIFDSATGDKLLCRIADILRRRLTGYGIYGRLEGDRFAVVVPKEGFELQTYLDGIQEFAYVDAPLPYQVDTYIGIYEIQDVNIPVAMMCDRALMALHTVKGSQRKYAFYDEVMRDQMIREKELSADLDGAMRREDVRIFLQPQVDTSGVAVGAEALVRWTHPSRGVIIPGDFIPYLEKSGLIAKVDRHVWELACRTLKKWKDHGKENYYISVNISPVDFYYMDIYEIFIELVKKYEISPTSIRLEITESAIMQNFAQQVGLIARLRNAGFIVEMDDFGSAYSSLNMLKDLYVDVLKLDMAFLGQAKDMDRAREILSSIVDLAKRLKIPVVCEGVETIEQVNFLKSIGCKVFQGYYYGRPMEVSAFEENFMK